MIIVRRALKESRSSLHKISIKYVEIEKVCFILEGVSNNNLHFFEFKGVQNIYKTKLYTVN